MIILSCERRTYAINYKESVALVLVQKKLIGIKKNLIGIIGQ